MSAWEAPDEGLRAVGGFLRARRQKLGLTQRQVASRSGVGHNSVIRYELGRRPVRTLEIAAGLATGLDVNPYGLLLMVADGAAEIDRTVYLPSILDQLRRSNVCGSREPECLAELVFLLRVNARKEYTVAWNAGVHPSTWGKLERGQYLPSIPVLEKITTSLGKEAEEHRVALLVLAMRDELRRRLYANRGEKWVPRWDRPANFRRPWEGER